MKTHGGRRGDGLERAAPHVVETDAGLAAVFHDGRGAEDAGGTAPEDAVDDRVEVPVEDEDVAEPLERGS